MKRHTKRQIQEAILYWKRFLESYSNIHDPYADDDFMISLKNEVSDFIFKNSLKSYMSIRTYSDSRTKCKTYKKLGNGRYERQLCPISYSFAVEWGENYGKTRFQSIQQMKDALNSIRDIIDAFQKDNEIDFNVYVDGYDNALKTNKITHNIQMMFNEGDQMIVTISTKEKF